MSSADFPRMFRLRQNFPPSPVADIELDVAAELSKLNDKITPGMSIAVAVGSRGITNLREIVTRLITLLKEAGAKPFTVPAMGSHGGATPEGQTAILAGYGISEENLGVPIRAKMETRSLGVTEDGEEVVFSEAALAADGIIIVNRVKPHTDFAGTLGSGVLKMMVVGLGKRNGAARYHIAAGEFGYERVIRTTARKILAAAPILGGLALVENQHHQTARIEMLRPSEMEQGEERLFAEAKALLPGLPFDELDLLIVDEIGKNISGTGMDTNVIGRSVHGYTTLLGGQEGQSRIRRIFVRGRTEETHGNAIGIGLADFTTARLAREMNAEITNINALTSMTPGSAKLPIYFESDREAIATALKSADAPPADRAKILRIQDTLNLEEMEASEAFWEAVEKRGELTASSEPKQMRFDGAGNLETACY